VSDKNDANNDQVADQLPDRLSTDPKSPYYNAEVLARDVGIRFKGIEKTNVEEYCVSEGWVRVTAGNAKDRYGNPLTIKVHGRAVFSRQGTDLTSFVIASEAKQSITASQAEEWIASSLSLLAMTSD
jgi:hypothetical protein